MREANKVPSSQPKLAVFGQSELQFGASAKSSLGEPLEMEGGAMPEMTGDIHTLIEAVDRGQIAASAIAEVLPKLRTKGQFGHRFEREGEMDLGQDIRLVVCNHLGRDTQNTQASAFHDLIAVKIRQ